MTWDGPDDQMVDAANAWADLNRLVGSPDIARVEFAETDQGFICIARRPTGSTLTSAAGPTIGHALRAVARVHSDQHANEAEEGEDAK